MSRYNCLYIDQESEEEEEDEIEDEYLTNWHEILDNYKEQKGDHGIKAIDLNDVSIVEIKQLNYAHPSDWEGKFIYTTIFQKEF